MKIGGGIGPARCSAKAVHARSVAVKGKAPDAARERDAEPQ